MKTDYVEVELCETVAGASHDQAGAPLYHVEIRYIPSKDAHSVVFRGERTRDKSRATAELGQARRLASRAWPVETK